MSLTTDSLYLLAGGLNIEGGLPALSLKKNKIWINVVTVLDRPLIDNITFDEIISNNKYPLLENYFDNINEHKIFATYITLINYYSHFNHDAKILVHIHQSKKHGQQIIKILQMLMESKTQHINFITDTDHFQETNVDYSDADILLSFSQCAGLDPKYEQGDLLIPQKFYIFDTTNNEINTKYYMVENKLIKDLDYIVNSEFNQQACQTINFKYNSYNENKNNTKLDNLSIADFKEASILQVSGLWNPTDPKQIIKLIEK
jgi:hypothetical protein